MRTFLLSLLAMSALLFITIPTASCQDYGFLSNEAADASVDEDDSDELPLPSIQVTTVIIRVQTDSSAGNAPTESDFIVLDLSAATLSDNDSNNNNNDAAAESPDESSDDEESSTDEEEVDTADADNATNDGNTNKDTDDVNSNASNVDASSQSVNSDLSEEDTDADDTN